MISCFWQSRAGQKVFKGIIVLLELSKLFKSLRCYFKCIFFITSHVYVILWKRFHLKWCDVMLDIETCSTDNFRDLLSWKRLGWLLMELMFIYIGDACNKIRCAWWCIAYCEPPIKPKQGHMTFLEIRSNKI